MRMDANTWQPATPPGPPPMGWMTGSGNISYLNGTAPSLAKTFFNTTSSFCTGASLTANPTPHGFAATPVLNLSSYTAPASGTAAGVPGLAALLTNGSTHTTPYIQYTYEWIAYDNEQQSSTPTVEQDDPVTYMQDFISACHSPPAGNPSYKVICAPGYDLFNPAKTKYPLNPGELQWQWFVRVIVAMGGVGCDLFLLQNESQQNTPIFAELWNATAATLATISPATTVVFADVSSSNATGSTQQELGANMADNAQLLTSPYPDGFYVAMPSPNQAAGLYFFEAMEAAGYSAIT